MKSLFATVNGRFTVSTFACIFAMGFCLGCGTPKFPVEGRVVFEDGKDATELNKGLVELQSIDVQPPVGARGEIGADGKFVLGTETEKDGVPAGRYRALVMPPRTIIDESKPLPPPVMERKFQQFETSGLEVTVESKPNNLTLKVERVKAQ